MSEETEDTQDAVEVVVGPLVRVALHGEDDFEVAFSELNEAAHTDHDPASVSDVDVIELIATHMDISADVLAQRVYGTENARVEKLVVSRPNTGNIMIRPETVLG